MGEVISALATILIFVAVVVILAIFYKKKGNKTLQEKNDEEGRKGEQTVASVLDLLKGKDGQVINDIILPVWDDSTTEIDHIMVSTKGVFVIETKNWAGIIQGDEEKENWIQTLGDGSVNNVHYSPVMQNSTHLRAVKILLNIPDEKIHSYIVFPKAESIDKVKANNVYNLQDFIENIKSLPDDVLTLDEVDDYFDMLQQYKECPIQSVEEHIKEVQQKHPHK